MLLPDKLTVGDPVDGYVYNGQIVDDTLCLMNYEEYNELKTKKCVNNF